MACVTIPGLTLNIQCEGVIEWDGWADLQLSAVGAGNAGAKSIK